MATNSPPSEDYIDIEVMNYCPSIVSFPQNRQFEFQMASITNDEKTPADELFYKGKLLPLINQKILPNSKDSFEEEEFFSINLLITPSGSCRVSLELNPNDHFIELSTELINSPKKVWSKKLKLIKQSSFSQKIKASKAYLKSLFCKSASTYEYDQQISNGNDMMKVSKKIPLKSNRRFASPKQDSIIKNIDKERAVDNVSSNNHSRSFSAAKFKRNSPAKSVGSTSFSSSNCSFNSNNGFYELNLFKRSSSFTSEMGSIEAAIAHCKNS